MAVYMHGYICIYSNSSVTVISEAFYLLVFEDHSVGMDRGNGKGLVGALH